MSETISLGSLRFAAHSRVSDPRWLTVTVDAGNYEDQFSLRLEDWLSLKLAADVIAAADWTISNLRTQLSEALLKCDVLRAELDRAAVEIAKLRREG